MLLTRFTKSDCRPRGVAVFCTPEDVGVPVSAWRLDVRLALELFVLDYSPGARDVTWWRNKMGAPPTKQSKMKWSVTTRPEVRRTPGHRPTATVDRTQLTTFNFDCSKRAESPSVQPTPSRLDKMKTLEDQPAQNVDILGVADATLVLETDIINIDIIEVDLIEIDMQFSACATSCMTNLVGQRLRADLKWHLKSRACDLQLAELQ